MKNTFRQSMDWLHTWAGLVTAWVLFFIFLTGTAGYFDTEIDRWMRPEVPADTGPVAADVAIAAAVRRLEDVGADAERWRIHPPVNRDTPELRIDYQTPRGADGGQRNRVEELLDAKTGQPIAHRDTGGGQLLYQMHYRLHYLPSLTARWIVGVCTLFMLVAIVTGIIVHKKIFKDFFTFRSGKGQRSWLDAHNVLGVMALPFHLMITYSGLVFYATTYFPMVVASTYGTGAEARQRYADEIAVRQPAVDAAGTSAALTPFAPLLAEVERRWDLGDVRLIEVRDRGDANARITFVRTAATPLRSTERLIFDGVDGRLLEEQPNFTSTSRGVRDVLLGLHEGLFAGPLLRWVYFLSGLLGTALIATGLVLWTVKRRTRHAKSGRADLGLAWVERLNIGTIAGLPIGIAAYFWANRLIPVEALDRAAWEVHVMFLAWAAALAHAHIRPIMQGWVEQLWAGGALLALLPVLNALTTERHLGVTLQRGDWVMAGFDLTVLAIGLLLIVAAAKVRRRLTQPAAAPTRRSTGRNAAIAMSRSEAA